MNENDVIEIIKSAGTGIDLSKITSSVALTDIGVDSLDIMSILMGVQEAADIEIPDDDVDELVSIEDIVKYVELKKSEN